MISEVPAIVQVQAVYSFKGKNNDELNFKKGDIITITQKEEGGWWEGTLDGKTGWFPSNYVKDVASNENKTSNSAVDVCPELQTDNRNLILKDLVDSEKNHTSELNSLIKSILTPLGSTDILSNDEYHHVLRNLLEILELHSTLVRLLEDCYDKPSLEQRVGNIFLSMAERMRTVHSEYCSNHPKAVCILESHKEKLGAFVESQGGRAPGLVYLTAGLSRPFRRLERYGGCLQELERYMEEFHPDRGDTQRSVFVYQNLATHCAAVRRQKEQELEVLCGSVRSWEGEEPSRLGELLYMGSIKLTSPPNSEVKDRHLVLFSQCIVLLSVSQRLSAFVFERKILLTTITLHSPEELEQSRQSFEILVAGVERLHVSCSSREDRTRLMDLLQKQIRSLTSLVSVSSAPYTAHSVSASTPAQLAQQKQERTRSPIMVNSRGSTPLSSRQQAQPTLSANAISLQYPLSQPISHGMTTTPILGNRVWSFSCLRPAPPITTRPCQERSNKKVSKSSRKRDLTAEDDFHLLQVVETYCNLTARTRQTIKSMLIESPQVLIAEEEKIIVEETRGTHTIIEEKSLVDTVYALRDQVKELHSQVSSLTKEVELLKSKQS